MADNSYRKINARHINDDKYNRRCVGCLILSYDNKILLQHRDKDAPTFPDYIATFGGGIESSETPLIALIRELKEELGAAVQDNEVISLGVLAEPETNDKTLVYMYFWHDRHNSITGCYEGKAKYIRDPIILDSYPKVMNDVIWALGECKKRHLI